MSQIYEEPRGSKIFPDLCDVYTREPPREKRDPRDRGSHNTTINFYRIAETSESKDLRTRRKTLKEARSKCSEISLRRSREREDQRFLDGIRGSECSDTRAQCLRRDPSELYNTRIDGPPIRVAGIQFRKRQACVTSSLIFFLF